VKALRSQARRGKIVKNFQAQSEAFAAIRLSAAGIDRHSATRREPVGGGALIRP
jgi:hypothetical protein